MEDPSESKDKSASKKSTQRNKKNSKGVKLYSKPLETHVDGEKKLKLRTSKDVYNRLKWDAASLSIDLTELYIGYKDRFLGMCEVKFSDFNPCSEEGDIPFHRIYYFRGGGAPVSPFIGKDGEVRVREDNWPSSSIIYWDRETRLDLIFNSGETFALSKRRTARKYATSLIDYTLEPIYQFNVITMSWERILEENEPGQHINVTKFKILSLNVLYELYDAEIVVPRQRWPYLIEFLEETDADLIALQEVTTPFLSLLESQEWVQKNYFLTEISAVGKTIQPYGQLFLTKFQPRQVFFSIQFSKRFLITSFLLGEEDSTQENHLFIANIHLNSDYNGDSAKIRGKQMRRLLQTFSDMDSNNSAEIIILGDTNFKIMERINQSESTMKLIDVWELLIKSEDPGFTFNVDENSLAKKLAKNSKYERFDRIFVKEKRRLLEPKKIQVIGKSPIDFSTSSRVSTSTTPFENTTNFSKENIQLSDHFALECEMNIILPSQSQNSINSEVIPEVIIDNLNKNIEEIPQVHSVVNTSAVVILPPKHFWLQIQNIRSQFDPSFTRWPPHINLIYGFIPDVGGNFESAQETLSPVLENIDPFIMTFSKIEIFQQTQKTATVYLTTSEFEIQKLKNLQSKLISKFPICFEQNKKLYNDFTPHLTIAKLPTETKENKENMNYLISKWKTLLFENSEEKLQFKVDRIHLLSRELNHTFKIKKTIGIGLMTSIGSEYFEDVGIESKNFLEDFLKMKNLISSSHRKTQEEEIMKEILTLCILAVGEVSIHLTGSSLMGFQDDTSDVDLLACGPIGMSHEAFFKALESVGRSMTSTSQTSKDCHFISIVLDTLVPIARFRMDNIDIDLVFCPCGPENWKSVSDQELQGQSEAFVRSIDGIRESDTLFNIISKDWWSTYCICVQSLKYWAKRRQIYSKVMGYLSSNTISLLVAHVIVQKDPNCKPSSPEALLEETFQIFSSWNWGTRYINFQKNANLPLPPKMFKSKGRELMLICAPCFPYLNRTRNVTKSTKTLIQKELIRANYIFSSIQRMEITFGEMWTSICQVENFFRKYPLYVKIQLKTKNDEDWKVCNGILSSRFVGLIVYLEQRFGVFCQPCTEIFYPFENSLVGFIGIDLIKTSPLSTELQESFELLRQKLQTWTAPFLKSTIEIEVRELNQGDKELEAFQLEKIQEQRTDVEENLISHEARLLENVSEERNMGGTSASGGIIQRQHIAAIVSVMLIAAIGIRRFWR